MVLPSLSRDEKLALEFRLQGFSTDDHPLALYRPWLERQGILTSSQFAACKHGDRVRVAGMIVMHQAPPTAKGMNFITLQDEEGLLDLVVTPDVYRRYRNVFRGVPLLVAEGMVEHNDGAIALLASRAASLPPLPEESPTSPAPL